MERGGLRVLQLWYGILYFRQAVEGNAGVQMMDVMIADIRSEPGHQRAGFHETGRFQSGLLIGPPGIITEGNTGEIVLGIKQITADRAGDEMRDEEGQEQGRPAEKPDDRGSDQHMKDDGNEAIIMLARIFHEGINAHAMKKNKNIPE